MTNNFSAMFDFVGYAGYEKACIAEIPTAELQYIVSLCSACEELRGDVLDELVMRGELERIDAAMVTDQGTYEQEPSYLERQKSDPDFEGDDQYSTIDDHDFKDLMEGDLDDDREEVRFQKPRFPWEVR